MLEAKDLKKALKSTVLESITVTSILIQVNSYQIHRKLEGNTDKAIGMYYVSLVKDRYEVSQVMHNLNAKKYQIDITADDFKKMKEEIKKLHSFKNVYLNKSYLDQGVIR